MKKSRIKTVFTVIVLIAVLAGIGFGLYKQTIKVDKDSQALSLYTVEKGPLTISVIEAGTIKARDVEIIKSEVEGNTTVLWVIDEATKVKKGDKLIELDASELTDDKIKQEISLLSANTSFIIAKEFLEVTKNKTQSDVEQAELNLKFAGMDLKKYEEGEYPTQVKDSLAKIAIAEQELQRTKDKLEWSIQLEKEKYISPTELKSDELAWKKAQLDLDLQNNQLALLKDYTNKRTTEELNSNVKQARMALERTKRKASADIIEAEAELKGAEAKYEREKSILDKIVQQISKTKIYAPNDGMVIYASSTKASWRSDEEPLTEGESVHEREELFHLPKADLVSVVANVHEANLDKVKIGSSVMIKVDAVPGEIFTGTVAKIAIMPDARMVYINPNLKVYRTEIFIDEKPGRATKQLRTGMGCQAEVVTAHYDNVIYVPIQAVITVGNQPTVYVYENGNTKPRDVEIGKDNNRMIHILNGLEEGEKVLMTPPLAQAEVKNNGKHIRKARRGQNGKPGGEGRPQGQGQRRQNGNNQMRKPPQGGGNNRPAAGKRPPENR